MLQAIIGWIIVLTAKAKIAFGGTVFFGSVLLVLLLEESSSGTSQYTLIVVSIVGFLSLIITAILAPLLIAGSQRKVLEQNRQWDLQDRADKEKVAREEREKVLVAAKSAAAQSLATADKLDVVHGQIDGMKDALVAAKEAEGHAAGEAEGRKKAIQETAARVEERERVEDRGAKTETTINSTDIRQIIHDEFKVIIDSGGFSKPSEIKTDEGTKR